MYSGFWGFWIWAGMGSRALVWFRVRGFWVVGAGFKGLCRLGFGVRGLSGFEVFELEEPSSDLLRVFLGTACAELTTALNHTA